MKPAFGPFFASIAALILLGSGFLSPSAALAESPSCGSQGGTTLTGQLGQGSVGVSGSCSVVTTDISGDNGAPVLVVDCGYATATDDHTFWNKECGPTGFPCPPVPGVAQPHEFMTMFALTQPPVPIAEWCAGATAPMPSAAALRDQVIRLLQPPPIGVSPSTGTGLVNLKTLFWITTPAQLDLGVAKLVGFPVQLRVNYRYTDFDFGDHTGATLTPTPGTPYDPSHDCGRCEAAFGHSYLSPGPITVTAHVYWKAQFRVPGHPWTTIDGDVTASRASSTTLTINQAHSTLVSPR